MTTFHLSRRLGLGPLRPTAAAWAFVAKFAD